MLSQLYILLSTQIMSQDQVKTKDSFKIKLGIFFGYNGQSYKGMQYQKDQSVKTVENVFHSTLFKLGFMLQTNITELRRVKWSRAARTDKKVHALCNAISVKLQISRKYLKDEVQDIKNMSKYQNKENIDYDKIINQLNANLPSDIKVYAIKKVTKKFDMRHDAKSRLYNYLVPTFAFQDYEDLKQGKIQTDQQVQNILKGLKQKIKEYHGTHNFHNFTKRIKDTDPRCFRFIINMQVEEVQKEVIQEYCKQNNIQNTKKLRFFRFTLLGQSFIYHQIRKMIGMLVQTKVQNLDQFAIKTAFGPNKMPVFLSPGQGLYLNRITFQDYNRKHDAPEKLQFSEKENIRISQFRKQIEKIILSHEFKDNVFSDWIKVYYQNPKKWFELQLQQEKEESEQVNNDEMQ